MSFTENKTILKSKLQLFSTSGSILGEKEFQTKPLVPALLYQAQVHT